MICSTGRPDEQPDLKKPTALRGAVGVWNRESSDRIKGCDGACIHAVGSLAGADGWSITDVTAFIFFQRSLLPQAWSFSPSFFIRNREGPFSRSSPPESPDSFLMGL